MVFNKKKYFICLFLVIALIGITIPTFYSNIFQETVVEGQDKFDPTTDEDKSEQVGEITKTFSNGYDLFTFANDVLKNGDGYDIENYSTVDAEAAGIQASINMYMHYQKNQNAILETIIFHSKMFSFANSKNITYLNLENNVAEVLFSDSLVKTGDSFKQNEFDFNKGYLEIKNYPDEFIQRFNRILEVMPFTITKKTASQNYFRSDNKYYYFDLTLKKDAVDPMFFRCFTAGLGADYYEYNFMSIEAVCNKKTGGFEQVTIKTGIKIPITKFGLNVTIDGVLTSILKVKKMNTPADFTYPQEIINFKNDNNITETP